MRYPLLLLYSLISANEALRILVSFPTPSKSHSILGQGFVDRLLEAGHEVVHLTTFPKEKEVPNLKEINVASIASYFMEELEKSDLLKLDNVIGKSNVGDSIMINVYAFMINKKLFEDPNVIQLLSDPNEKFDAVIIEWFFSELNAGLSHLFEAPLIWVASTEPHWQVLRLIDEVPNPAYNVDILSSNTAPLSFCQRLEELMRLVRRFIIFNFIQVPFEMWAYNNIYPEIAAKRGVSMPSYSETVYNASLMFINSHPSIGGAMKLPQSAVNIAGYHIPEKVKPLPEAIMDGAKNGVVYFSLGSNMKSDGMSDKMKQSLLNMFSKLKQTVIWKFESDTENSAPNVHLVKWAPQTSILAHPNLKLFITHGGQLSTTEAVHFGVPLVGIPIFADQYINMASIEKNGFGIKVTLAEDMIDELEAAVKKVLSDESFKVRAKEISAVFHNRPMKPGKALAYWIEYVVKTHGAKHLRSPALTVCFCQRFYLDLLAVTLVGLFILRKLYTCLMRKRSKTSSQKKKKE